MLSFLHENLQGKGFNINYDESFFDEKTGWRGDLYFSMFRVMMIFYGETDVYYNDKGKAEEASLIHKIIHNQLSETRKYTIIPISIAEWKDMNIEKQKSAIFPLMKLIKS